MSTWSGIGSHITTWEAGDLPRDDKRHGDFRCDDESTHREDAKIQSQDGDFDNRDVCCPHDLHGKEVLQILVSQLRSLHMRANVGGAYLDEHLLAWSDAELILDLCSGDTETTDKNR